MRKVSSCPQLAGQDASAGRSSSRGLSAQSLAKHSVQQTGTAMRRGVASCNALVNMHRDDSSLISEASFGGNTSTVRRSSARQHSVQTRAMPFLDVLPAVVHAPSAPELEQVAAEAGEWLMEGAGHGVLSADCFELFGFPEDAPNIRSTAPDSPGSAETAERERVRKTAEAACLLSPASGQERDMGQQLHAAVRQAAVERELQTQLRYAGEIRRQAASELQEESEARPFALELERTNPRRRRRSKDAPLSDEEVLRLLETAEAAPTTAPNADVSPRTREAVAATFGTLDSAARKSVLSIDEDDMPAAAKAGNSAAELVAASIDLPEAPPPGIHADGQAVTYQPVVVLESNGPDGSVPALASRLWPAAPTTSADAAAAAAAASTACLRQQQQQRSAQLREFGPTGQRHMPDGARFVPDSAASSSAAAATACTEPNTADSYANSAAGGRLVEGTGTTDADAGSEGAKGAAAELSHDERVILGQEAAAADRVRDGSPSKDSVSPPQRQQLVHKDATRLEEITNSPRAGNAPHIDSRFGSNRKQQDLEGKQEVAVGKQGGNGTDSSCTDNQVDEAEPAATAAAGNDVANGTGRGAFSNAVPFRLPRSNRECGRGGSNRAAFKN